MCSGKDDWALPQPSSLIRRSAGQRLFSASPRLIAAVHVLHRLLVPRHPPSALSILTEEHHMSLCRFQGTRGTVSRTEEPHRRRGLSKLSSVGRGVAWALSLPCRRSSRLPRDLRRKMRSVRNATSPSTILEALRCWTPQTPRKEVIQPHLPVRLPCYDFTPITEPTFDGSLPCGLGHRLRVFPTFVV
jgi:hypothetical protein